MNTNAILVSMLLTACGAVAGPQSSDDMPGDGGAGAGSDSGAPDHPAGALYGSVIDERGDTIDFASGEPVHTHAGATIDLGQGCPDVYYYAYLLDQGSPTYGREKTLNPLAWRVTSPLASTESTSYRVMMGAEVVRDWTPVAAPTDGVYTIELHRNGQQPIAALGTTNGTFYLDVRFRDGAGNEMTSRACWKHHPLAAPASISALAPSELFGMSLPAHSPISELIIDLASSTGTGVDVASAPIVQYTAEPITMKLALQQPTGTVAASYVDTWIAYGVVTSGLLCSNVGACDVGVPATQTTSTTGDLANSQWLVRVIDDATNQSICTAGAAFSSSTCTLPARAPASPPRSYHAIVSVGGIAALRAPVAGTYGEFVVGTTHFTGITALGGKTSCGQITSKTAGGPTSCAWYTSYEEVEALNSATISFAPMSVQLSVAPAANASFDSLHPLTTAALVWNAGSGGI